MPREIDIHFFRDNLVPMWEDSPEGGIVILKIKKDDNIDKMWESILFSMIGKSYSFNLKIVFSDHLDCLMQASSLKSPKSLVLLCLSGPKSAFSKCGSRMAAMTLCEPMCRTRFVTFWLWTPQT